jgi:hypothetical protein
MRWRLLMNCRQAYQRKDNSHDEIGKDFNASWGGVYRRRGRSALERKPYLEHIRSGNGGSGHYRPATDTDELRWSCEADRQKMCRWRVLLLATATGLSRSQDYGTSVSLPTALTQQDQRSGAQADVRFGSKADI